MSTIAIMVEVLRFERLAILGRRRIAERLVAQGRLTELLYGQTPGYACD